MTRSKGFTLIEVLVAVAVLGVAVVATFSLFSTSLVNLRKLQDLHRYQIACEEVMNRALVLDKLPAQASLSGRFSDLAADWNLSVGPWYPTSLDNKPDQAIMRLDVNLVWITRAGKRTLHMESLKPATIAYSNYDLSQAIDRTIPR